VKLLEGWDFMMSEGYGLGKEGWDGYYPQVAEEGCDV